MSAETADFATVFGRLRQLLLDCASELECVRDEPGDYYLNTGHIMKNKQNLFFGAAQIRKNYVSYHLMPVYVFPELLAGLSPALHRRMQGKSCFNFKVLDQSLLDELATLTAKGLERYVASGYVSPAP